MCIIKNENTMATRNQHARQSSNTVSLEINGIYLTLLSKNWNTDKSFLYLIKEKIINGKINVPSIEEKTGVQPFLLGYCNKEIPNVVEFIWN